MSKENTRSNLYATPPLRYIHEVICFLRKGHNFHKEVVVNNYTTLNFCRCGRFMISDWSSIGGYKRAMSELSNLKRKRKWDNS